MPVLAFVEDHAYVDHPDPEERPPCLGQWCCGCDEHPAGKPWGWNFEAWTRHYEDHHPDGLTGEGQGQ